MRFLIAPTLATLAGLALVATSVAAQETSAPGMMGISDPGSGAVRPLARPAPAAPNVGGTPTAGVVKATASYKNVSKIPTTTKASCVLNVLIYDQSIGVQLTIIRRSPATITAAKATCTVVAPYLAPVTSSAAIQVSIKMIASEPATADSALVSQDYYFGVFALPPNGVQTLDTISGQI